LADVSFDTISSTNGGCCAGEISGFLIPYNFDSATLWQYTGTPCVNNNWPCPGWQALSDSTDIAEAVADNGLLYKRSTSGTIYK